MPVVVNYCSKPDLTIPGFSRYIIPLLFFVVHIKINLLSFIRCTQKPYHILMRRPWLRKYLRAVSYLVIPIFGYLETLERFLVRKD